MGTGSGVHWSWRSSQSRPARTNTKAFEAEVEQIDAVIECHRMFGHPDYLLRVAVEDLPAYERLYMATLTGLPGVARTNSQFTMKTVKA